MSKLALRTVKDVEIVHSGIEYKLSTGNTTFTPEDLRDCVMAANEDPSIPNPRLKLGHTDPRYNDESLYDASPSFGKATNLRLSPNGTTVLADYVGVPAWLAEIMPAAFPSRSIEGYWNIQSSMGKKWRFVLSACSLLGVTWPGISVLEDLPLLEEYYGEEMPASVVVDPEMVAATGGDPNMKSPFKKKDGTAASANLDDVRRAFYQEYMPSHPESSWWWIQAVLTDPNELVVEDDESGQLYKIPFTSDDQSEVAFGDASAVRIDYVPEDREAVKAAAPHVAATLAIGREVVASWANREDSVLPTNASGGAMDPKEIRQRLGLPEDASDEQVKEAVRALNVATGVAPEPAPAVEGTTPKPEEQPAPAAAPVEAQPVPVAASGLPAGTVLVDKAQFEGLVAATTETSNFIKKQKERDRENLVKAAMSDGRIAPASKDHWLKHLETDPNGEATLASLQPGLIPVELRGRAQDEETTASGLPGQVPLTPELVSQWSADLFPEVREQQRVAAALAAGESGVRRSRVSADANYSRR